MSGCSENQRTGRQNGRQTKVSRLLQFIDKKNVVISTNRAGYNIKSLCTIVLLLMATGIRYLRGKILNRLVKVIATKVRDI